MVKLEQLDAISRAVEVVKSAIEDAKAAIEQTPPFQQPTDGTDTTTPDQSKEEHEQALATAREEGRAAGYADAKAKAQALITKQKGAEDMTEADLQREIEAL